MIIPENQPPEEPRISAEALFGLKRAIGNINRYGWNSVHKRPSFVNLGIVNNLLNHRRIPTDDKPSHLYSGPAMLSPSGILYRVFTRVEGTEALPTEIDGQPIKISSAYSIVKERRENGEPSLFGNTVTTEDGRIFHSIALPPFEEASYVGEQLHEAAVWGEIAVLKKDLADFAEQYPEVE